MLDGEVNKKNFLCLVDKLNEYMKKYRNKESKYYYALDERLKSIEISEAFKIIKILNKPKYIWFARSFMSHYTFNGRLNLTSNFYWMFSNNFSLMDLLAKIHKEKISFELFNWNDKNEKYINIYNKYYQETLMNYLIRIFFFKYFLDAYVLKYKNVARNKKYIRILTQKIHLYF